MASQIAWRGLDPGSALLELAPQAGEDLVPEEAILTGIRRLQERHQQIAGARRIETCAQALPQ